MYFDFISNYIKYYISLTYILKKRSYKTVFLYGFSTQETQILQLVMAI